jgi:hypothetical protein
MTVGDMKAAAARAAARLKCAFAGHDWDRARRLKAGQAGPQGEDGRRGCKRCDAVEFVMIRPRQAPTHEERARDDRQASMQAPIAAPASPHAAREDGPWAESA